MVGFFCGVIKANALGDESYRKYGFKNLLALRQKLTKWQEKRNKAIAKRRCGIEHLFGAIKHFGAWLNAVEKWFSRLERKGLQRKACQSVKQLREHLREFIVTYNKYSAKPFVWKKTAQQVIESVERAKLHAAAQNAPIIL